MKTPHLLDTSFFFNLRCALQSLATVPGLQPDETKALKSLDETVELIQTDPETTGLKAAIERQYQEFRGLAWNARNDVARRGVLDAALMLVDSIRCVLSSRAMQGKRPETQD